MLLNPLATIGAGVDVPDKAWEYGVLGVVTFVLGATVWYLFRRYESREKELQAENLKIQGERNAWQLERQGLINKIETGSHDVRVEYEEKHRSIVEKYAQDLRGQQESAREHEDQVRKEFAELMERVATEGGKATSSLVDMLQKFYERFVGPRGRY